MRETRQDGIGARRSARPLRAASLVLAVAATATAVLLWQSMSRSPRSSAIRDFRVVPYGSTQTVGPARWRPASPFVLRFTFDQDAYALIFHVGADGTPSLLFPEGRLQAFAGKAPVQLPAEGTGEAWLLGDEAGPRWFLLVGSRQPGLDLTDVLRRMDALADEEAEPAATASALEKLLEVRVGAPRVLRIEVVDEPDLSAARPARRSPLY
jgi:hypothetical protein